MTDLTAVRPSIAEDPAPVPPEMPMDSECCESGCERCVWTVYQEDKLDYERRYAAWLIRHPDHAPHR